MEKRIELNEKYQVVMHNDLIKSKTNLPLNETKLLRIAIMQIVKEDTDFQTYTVSVKELANFLGIDRHYIYQEIDKITTNLLREIVYIGDGNPKNKYIKFQWCSECVYEDGIITLKLHDRLKPFLLSLSKIYTQYMISDILCLKSVYSIRIYELIQQAKKNKQVYADKIEYVYLSEKDIRIATNTEDKYEKHSMFKARVIEAAINEINSKLQYYITYNPKKTGKKITGYEFVLRSRYYNVEISPEKLAHIEEVKERAKRRKLFNE